MGKKYGPNAIKKLNKSYDVAGAAKHMHMQLQILVFGAEINSIKDEKHKNKKKKKINHNDILKN